MPKTGRKPIFGETMRRVVVKMTDKHVKMASKIGGKNVSKGVRLALEKTTKIFS